MAENTKTRLSPRQLQEKIDAERAEKLRIAKEILAERERLYKEAIKAK